MERFTARQKIEDYFLHKGFRSNVDPKLYGKYLKAVRLYYSVKRKIYGAAYRGIYWSDAMAEEIQQDGLRLIELYSKRVTWQALTGGKSSWEK